MMYIIQNNNKYVHHIYFYFTVLLTKNRPSIKWPTMIWIWMEWSREYLK